MQKLLMGLKILTLTLTSLCLGLGAFAVKQTLPQVKAILTNLETTSRELGGSAASARELLTLYQRDLSSDKNRKALEASLAAAASWQATARLVNTQVVPELTTNLTQLAGVSRSAQQLLDQQNHELSLTQDQARQLIAALTTQTEGLGPEISRLASTSSEAAGAGGRAAAEAELATKEMTKILQNIHLASNSAPAIADSLEKIAASGQKWQRPLSLLTLLAAIFGAIR